MTNSNLIIPSIYDTEGKKVTDPYSKLLENRIIFVSGTVAPQMANLIVAQLLYLNSKSTKKPIWLYVNSPGGYCSDGLEIIDVMNHIKAPVGTVVTGMAASMGCVIAACGKKGLRHVMPHAEIMMHKVRSGAHGDIQDMQVSMKQAERTNTVLMELLAKATNRTIEQIELDTSRDKWLNSKEALIYNLVDKIL